jgi:putative transposase
LPRRHDLLDFAGSLHFVTAVTRLRGQSFVEDAVCLSVLQACEHWRRELELECFAYVLMPDHFHLVVRQWEDGPLIRQFMTEFMRATSPRFGTDGSPASGLWRERYTDTPIPGISAVMARINYVHRNPLERGLVAAVEDYPWSSARDFLGIERGPVKLTHPRSGRHPDPWKE